ncbi:MAG TPA: hypothetical protein VGV35_17775 [Bryobacteraceae bacterium]|nr:hypothetical protein [Bryobacteraceae bacterium]
MANGLYLTVLAGPVVAVPVPKPLTDALTSVTVTVSDTGTSGFQLTFTLADRSILQTLFLLAGGAPIPMFRVILMATAGVIPQVLMDGVITHHEITPDVMHGSTTLTITGEDLTTVMNQVDLSGLPYPGMTPDLRVLTILAKYAAFGVIPAVIPTFAPDVPIPIDKIPAQKGTDLAYIRQLASEAGYVIYIEPGPAPGISTAYWGPQIKIGLPQPALNVNMDTWTNVESLSFRYEPQNAVLPIVFMQEPISKATIPIPIPPVSPLNPPLGAVIPIPTTVEQLKDTANLSPPQALMRGLARATETGDVVTGEGTLDVLRYGQVLKARQLVGVRGAGLGFDGLHYVQKTTHQLKRSEYKQSFTLKRNGIISNLPIVPALPL